jgi:oxidase EvaA
MEKSSIKQVEIDFFKSALTKKSSFLSTPEILSWIQQLNSEIKTNVKQIPLEKLHKWIIHKNNGFIQHESGNFFSIEGIEVQTNWGHVQHWEQPIINQPEIGLLGILTKKIDGILHFLMQAKIEPGNLNVVQISPTLQATKSNYTQVHKGKTPHFLEYFLNSNKNTTVLLDQLQSEQGARFLKKRNRNIIVEVKPNVKLDIPSNFQWMTLGQIKDLIKYDNVINMDTRTVISGISFGSYSSQTIEFFSTLNEQQGLNKFLLNSILNNEFHLNDYDRIFSWITNLKSKYELNVKSKNLNQITDWIFDGNTVEHKEKKYFSVIGVNVEIENREVTSWDQPMILPAQEGIVAFLIKKINGVYHFLVQAKLEAGNFDIIELAPTVQCLTGNYRTGLNEYSVPFIQEVIEANTSQIWYSALQSEEGGRFFQEQNKNMIIETTEEFSIEVPENYCWMTLNQLLTFIKFNNYLNIASRSLISAINF